MLMGRQYLILYGLGQLCSSKENYVYSESGGKIASVLKSSMGGRNPGPVRKGYRANKPVQMAGHNRQ